jgi:uracil-DNA glycosylase family 4
VTDARELFRRYLEQQADLGQPPLILDAPPRPSRSAPAQPAPREVRGGDEVPRRELPPVDRAAPPARTARARPPAPERSTGRQGKKEPAGKSELPAIPGQGIVVPAPATDLFAKDPLADLTLDQLGERIRACTECRLHKSRTNAVPGEGPPDARLVVVGEGPGATEDAQGRPFVGRAGALLDDILAAIDCPRETVYIANVVKCRPPDNRKPQGDEMEACMPYLHRQLALIRPKVILAMGATAAEALLQARASLSALRNRVHDYRGTPLIVTYHPAALLRNPNWKRPTWDDVRIARQLLDR